MATQLAEMPDSLGGGEVAEQEIQTQERDIEAEARVMGWRPKEEYEGPPGAWKPAEEFVEFRENNLGIKRKEVTALRKELNEVKKLAARLQKAEQEAYENARADLQAKMEEAVAAGDFPEFKKIEAKVEKLDKRVRADTVAPEEAGQIAYEEFRDNNAWYDRGALAAASDVEVDARAYADRLADKYARQKKHLDMDPADFFQLIADETLAKFPDLNKRQPRQKPASDVASPTGRVAARGAKTGANLPPEAKEHAERYMRMGLFKVKTKAEAYEKFAQSYTGPWN